MRLGFLGPNAAAPGALERAARVLLEREGADRVHYLGDDGALDLVVASWAERLVGGDPADAAVHRRAAARCASADAEGIARFVAAERGRARLAALVSLPGPAAKTVEIFDGRVVLLAHDKASLDADDILPASVLVYGRSAEPVVRKVGARTFVAPGRLGDAGGAGMLHLDAGGALVLRLFDAAGEVRREETLVPSRGAPSRAPAGPTG